MSRVGTASAASHNFSTAMRAEPLDEPPRDQLVPGPNGEVARVGGWSSLGARECCIV